MIMLGTTVPNLAAAVLGNRPKCIPEIFHLADCLTWCLSATMSELSLHTKQPANHASRRLLLETVCGSMGEWFEPSTMSHSSNKQHNCLRLISTRRPILQTDTPLPHGDKPYK
jgi:hypothetical protein